MNKDNKNSELDNTDKKLHISDVIVSDVLEQIESWKEIKKCYKEEIEMGIDIDMNKWLFENCDEEIKQLEILINHKSVIS